MPAEPIVAPSRTGRSCNDRGWWRNAAGEKLPACSAGWYLLEVEQ